MRTVRGCVALLAGAAAVASATSQPVADMELRSCVGGSPALRVPASTERSTLDAADRQRFDTAAQSRFPLYQRGGFRPWQVLLLRRGGQWLYVTLWHDGHDGSCFSAVFSADRFEFTPEWIQKYRPRSHEAAD